MEGRSTGRGPARRVTMQDAAEELGVTVEAIRKRVQRGSIRSDKGEDGRRYVYLDTGRDTSDTKRPVEGSPELVDSLRDQVEYLRGQLEAERQAHAEARRIIGGLVQRIPELEAPAPDSPPEARESSESPGPTRIPTDAGGAPEMDTQPRRRGFWRRVFGG